MSVTGATGAELPDELSKSLSPNFSDECIRYCPELHQCAMAALIRYALEGGELIDVLNQEVIRKQELGELPTKCEIGPTRVSGGATRPGGARVRLANLRASTFWGVDGWDHPTAVVCQMDGEALFYGRRSNAPWEDDDYRTGLFTGDLKTEFLKTDE